MSVRRKLLAFSIFIALILGGYVVLIWYPGAERQAIRDIEANIHDKLAITTEVLVPLMIKRQYAAIYEDLDAILQRHKDWLTLTLFDDSGRKIYPLVAVARPEDRELRIIDHDIDFRDNRMGKLVLVADLKPSLKGFRARLLRLSAVLSMIFVLSMTVIIYFVDVFVSAPALKLADLADKLAQGDYHSPLPKTGNDELGKLARAFDDMRQAVLEKTGTVQQFGQIMDDSINEIYLFDRETLLFNHVNRAARENLQFLIDEIRTMTPVDIKPEMTKTEFRHLIAPLLSGDVGNISFTTKHRRKDGSDYPVEINLQLSKVTDPP
ncbi:MAG TPA: HAMP domain-containing protein, partial [Rhodospirillales bacterium]|nr:HAMP domain-containing protein [Rhodospirillales bacterium]